MQIGDVEFEGLAHCAPCVWMNGVMKKGAYAQMQGRGGLRVKVISDGILKIGASKLEACVNLEENPMTRLKKPKLP